MTYSQDVAAVKGTVLDKDGDPLVGVSVLIEGSTTGTITDIDGNFQLEVPNDAVLVFSMISMQSKRIPVGNQTSFQVTLEDEAAILNEVVITGFQEVERKLFTGASESVKMSEVQARGMVDISRMLEGQVAGVNVDNVSGTFGTTPKIRIRGNASINGNNQPLFVVDGVILEDLSDVNTDDFISGNANTLVSSSIANLNPDDIESFEILKDASATAIYGARAANGVIVITTKRGRSGALQVSYSGNFSVKLRPTYNQFDLLNSAEEMSVYRELFDKNWFDATTVVASPTFGALGKMFNSIFEKDINWRIRITLRYEFCE